ncbi:MAG: hypothetical protein ABIW76_09790 [Fibrobacteria bacterium]
MMTNKYQILLSGAALYLGLSGYALGKSDSRPAALGGEPRAEAERSLDLMKLFDNPSLVSLGLSQEQLANSVIGIDSVLIYHIPGDFL